MTEPDIETLLCAYKDGKRALHHLRFESGQTIVVCTPCKKLIEKKDKTKRCQYCGIPIWDTWKKPPLDGFEHVAGCPRSENIVLEIG